MEYKPEHIRFQSDTIQEMLKEKPPDKTLHYYTNSSNKNTECVPQVSHSFLKFILRDSEDVLINLLRLQENKSFTYKTSYTEPLIYRDSVATRMRELSSLSFCREPIMHLLLSQNVEIISGSKEAVHKELPPEKNLLQSHTQDKKISLPILINTRYTKEDSVAPDQKIGVILSYLLRGEPPDAPRITIPQVYQGKTLNSQRRMKANLLSLGAGDIVSRSKLLQGGGYDEDIKSTSAMEKEIRRKPVENMKLRRAKEANQDICAIKTPYLTNQEEFIHETGFVGFYTQQGNAENWFHIKKINGLEDMPFQSQRWPDLPYLEDQWFNQLQTKHWRPGDLSMHSGYTSKGPGEPETFLTCTSIHQTTWNQRRSYLPFLDSKAINSQQLFSHQAWHDFYHYFSNQEVPKKLSYSLKPSRYKAINPALESSHWNHKILQQLVFFMFDFLSILL
ncbi:hypothetical protein N665_3819s0001 [Sinapis alba]|nr:hypothetical protein N665_3819s0001 [Sinapis alba]